MLFVARGHASTFTQTPHSGSATVPAWRRRRLSIRNINVVSVLFVLQVYAGRFGGSTDGAPRNIGHGPRPLAPRRRRLPRARRLRSADRRTALSDLIVDSRRSTTGRKSTVAAGLVPVRTPTHTS